MGDYVSKTSSRIQYLVFEEELEVSVLSVWRGARGFRQLWNARTGSDPKRVEAASNILFSRKSVNPSIFKLRPMSAWKWNVGNPQWQLMTTIDSLWRWSLAKFLKLSFAERPCSWILVKFWKRLLLISKIKLYSDFRSWSLVSSYFDKSIPWVCCAFDNV